MKRFAIFALVLCLTATLTCRRVFAQTTSATLNGVVTDSGGSAIPGAQLSIVNIDTQVKQAAETNEAGQYSISQLSPGRYTVTVQKDGFQSSVQTGIVLTVGQAATLNVTMIVGQVSESVTVVANAELINVSTPEISAVVNQNSVAGLPLNGRDPSGLVLLTTGTMNILPTGNRAGTAVGGGWAPSAALPNESGASSGGGRQGSTYYVLDGGSNMDIHMGLAAPFPNSDSTQEFRIITENFDVQYGFSPGAIVNIRTKSGTNSFHGGVFEFLRNNDLNAANFFSHQVDPLKRNQFGGFLGGPIRKDKFFFFGNYQATRTSSAATANTTYMPTQAMLNGDFSVVPVTLRAPFVNNVIDPTTWMSLVATPGAPGYPAYLLATTSLPLGQDPATGKITFAGPAQKTSFNEGTGRFDYSINDKHRLFLRNFINYYSTPFVALKGNIANGANLTGFSDEDYSEALGHSWLINSNTVNNLTLFYTQLDAMSSGGQLDKNGDRVCWSRYIAISDLTDHCNMEQLNIYGGPGGTFTSTSGFVTERRITWGLSEQFLKTIQRHSLTFGVDVHKQRAQENSIWPAPPPITFNGSVTGFGWADFLLGEASSFQQGGGEIVSLKGYQLGIYAQERYNVRPNFTISVGMRWDPNFPPAMTNGRGAAFRPGRQSIVYPNAPVGVVFPGDKGISSSLMPNSYGYFQPRIGLTWQPKFIQNLAIRAGFGLFTGPFPYEYYNHTADLAPFSPTFTLTSGTALYPNYVPLATPWVSLAGGNPFPPFASLSTKPPSTTAFQTPMNLGAVFDSHFKNGTTQSWSLSAEQQLSQTVALHVAYVGSESYHQSVVVDQNPGCVPAYVSGCVLGSNVRIIEPSLLSSVYAIESAGTSSYHSLQVAVDKHLGHGFEGHSNFTWSKVMDIVSEGDPSEGGSFPGLWNPYNLRASRAISDLNRPFISTSYFTYTSPSLANRESVLANIFGAWGLSAIYTLQSGRPFGVAAGGSANNSGALQDHDRADRVPGAATLVKHGSRSQWLTNYVNLSAFTNNAPGTFGNTARNLFRAPYINTADTSISKVWTLREQCVLQFRWEMFNTFNHTSFDVPASYGVTLSDMEVGASSQITSVGPIPPRVMQGGLKLTF